MAEPTQFMFKHKELVTTLVKAQGLREGFWQLSVNFGFAAANVGPTPDDINPSAVCPVLSIGIQRVDSLASPGITVDAAVVNPIP